MTSLQIADVDHSPLVNVWINETSIGYNDEGSNLGSLSKQGYAPTRVFVEKKMSMCFANNDVDDLRLKATLERASELALLLKGPRRFGFATMPCLGVTTDLNDKSIGPAGEMKLVSELAAAADPVAHSKLV
ncbi:hypothetical protein HO133_002029 [Letharia lupina]|uniref:Uncharacterized protein n=1 Tax=Letharia lupina TaxID=560253 RepID=A0A8H6CCR5_9LECA|nr:uncharacterized protein HO133_002029 [Letharia lupina]KAF6221175.1 hypothetical protein HO133_002029 [Letharia lupina]